MDETTNPANQIAAWKDADTQDTDHPAGTVTLPKTRGQLARMYALAGIASGVAMVATVTPVLPTLTGGTLSAAV